MAHRRQQDSVLSLHVLVVGLPVQGRDNGVADRRIGLIEVDCFSAFGNHRCRGLPIGVGKAARRVRAGGQRHVDECVVEVYRIAVCQPGRNALRLGAL